MSRILRRPMFRGGRVDSRGTGITSGLGYKKGGSVQERPGYLLGGQILRAGLQAIPRYGKQGLGYLQNLFKGKPSTSKELVPPGYKFTDDFIGDFRRNLGVTGKFRDIPGVSPVLNYIAKNPKKSLGAGVAFGLSDYTDMLPSGETIGRALLPGKLERLVFDDEEEVKKVEEAQDDNSPQVEAILKGMMENKKKELESKLPTEEDLEINKEKYSKLLGGDKAKAEDISNMLLSFAGKALGPEATVKSAFAEFAEEEAKRPSKKSKVDESAAALAINEYIAGKKSRAELDRFFAEMDYKKSLASRAGQEYVASNIAEAKKSASGYQAIELGLQISFPEGGRPVKIEKGQANEVPLTLDNLNKVFIEDEAPYTAVQIVAVDGKLVRNPVY